MMKAIRIFLFTCAIVILSGCAKPGDNASTGLPNPASVYCEDNGGNLEIRTGSDGGQFGVCVFPDGSECDEWAYFRGECAPKGLVETAPAATPATAAWQPYTNADLGYTFNTPPNTIIVANDEPDGSITISGLDDTNNRWPQITLSHPDRADFHPPAGADLRQWLADHNLAQGDLLADVQIGGETAAHQRFDRSPQSFAYDRYYFAHNGQLYMLVIGHVGDLEDWDVYNTFLSSFQFTN